MSKLEGLVITGPTCSGKSALALQLALKINGVVINADSMQVYKDLRVLSARPTEDEEALVSHKLYGILDASEGHGNAAWWVDQALDVFRECEASKKVPIITGGTGMYLNALFTGLSQVPKISQEIRDQIRDKASKFGPAALRSELIKVDAESANRIDDMDAVRLCRALEVWEETGKPLSWWRKQVTRPKLAYNFSWVHLNPPRETLRNKVHERLEIMVASGAIEEVKKLLELSLPGDHPILRAHGVPEIIRFLEGGMSLEDAVSQTSMNISRYTKRQRTWFRHHHIGDYVNNLEIPTRLVQSKATGEGELEVAKELENVYSFWKQNPSRS